MADWTFHLHPVNNDSRMSVSPNTPPRSSRGLVTLDLHSGDDSFEFILETGEANLLGGALLDAAREAT